MSGANANALSVMNAGEPKELVFNPAGEPTLFHPQCSNCGRLGTPVQAVYGDNEVRVTDPCRGCGQVSETVVTFTAHRATPEQIAEFWRQRREAEKKNEEALERMKQGLPPYEGWLSGPEAAAQAEAHVRAMLAREVQAAIANTNAADVPADAPGAAGESDGVATDNHSDHTSNDASKETA